MSPICTREEFEREEAKRLAPYATKSLESKGRLTKEPEHPYRTVFQRDRDRVLHSRAFRRLEYKTQVFVYHEGDHYRNRLTHTLEGAQIARTLARALRLNEDLTEAIMLAHDLGHTPFGHAGERTLRDLMRDHGGFEHNWQSLRVVDLLERRHGNFRGLNLTWETRGGLLKHGNHWEHPVSLPVGKGQLSVEAQICDLADEIAYLNHDLDDGVRSGLIELEQLDEIPIWREATQRARVGARGDVAPRVLQVRTVAVLINIFATDLVESTAKALTNAGLRSAEEVSLWPTGLVGFSEAIQTEKATLRRFLYKNLYSNYQVVRMSRKAGRILKDLFEIYTSDPAQLPPHVVDRIAEEGEERAIADYIAGMTDRFALEDHRKLMDPHVPV